MLDGWRFDHWWRASVASLRRESVTNSYHSIWVRTTDLCYAAEKGLTRKIDKNSLDNCGPLPRLEVNRTETFTTRRHAAPPPLPKLEARYLINVTVGEDYAYCHEKPLTTTPILKAYEFMTEVFLQCITQNNDPADPNNTFWELTTDFCYVRSLDFFESPEGDCKSWSVKWWSTEVELIFWVDYKFPDCSNFGQS